MKRYERNYERLVEQKMKDVFISYKSEEVVWANWVKESLENAGITCWMAPDSIPGGSSYAREIPKAIKGCDIFVLLLSEKSQKSDNVQKEIELAHRNAKRMMPFIIEECRLEDDFEYYLANVQYYRAYIDAEKEMIKMISDIKEHLGMSKEDIQKTDRDLEKKKRQRRKKAKKRRYFKIKIGIWVVLLLLVYKFMYLTIAGERVGRFDGYIQLSDEELTQRDWRKIKKLKKLTVIEIVNCKLPDENIGEICNEQVWFLRLENCGISDKHIQTIDFENMQRLNTLDISGNPDIMELSALGDQVENLIHLDISNTSITDLGFLENAQKLQRLHADNTGVADLSGLSDCYELKEISLDTNKLMNFEGLEKCLKLSVISAKDNQITGLKGLENTTQIREFVLDNNQLEDLSVLKKSQKTLEAVSVNNNKLKDLTEIHEAVLLKVLFADENQLQNLSALSELTVLEKVSVQGNEIESIAGIENCINLREIDLSDNQISECSELGEMMLNHSLILDLSENNLRDLTLPFVTRFEYLSLNGNPLRNIDALYGKSVHRCDLTFSALIEYPKLSENIDYLYIVGCPLDRRLELEDVFSGGRIKFVTEIDMSDGLSGNVNTTMETVETQNARIDIDNPESYIFSESAEKYLTEKEVEEMCRCAEEQGYGAGVLLRYAINEIYARKGHEFIEEYYESYLKYKTWYQPIPGKEVTEEELNTYEKANIDLLVQFEKKIKESE